jgi:hypothetical protein
MDLDLVEGRTSTVYRAEEGGWQFNLHSYVTYFDGRFWAVWSSSPADEESSAQVIRYASSVDGHDWSESGILADDPDGPENPALWIARGVFVHQGRLTALGAYIGGETQYGLEGSGEVWPKLSLRRFEWSGDAWEEKGVFLEDCMNNYPPRPLENRLFMTCRDSYGRMYTALSASPEGADWSIERLPGEEPLDRMSEPSWYVDPEGVVHLIFRDQRRSRQLCHSISEDMGVAWTAPVVTNYPDATSKNITGLLSNGYYYLINNPNQQGRDPLGISFSQDGWTFMGPRALRKEAPSRRYPGRAKPDKSFQYPHAMEKDGSLWVIYSTNKEDIEITEYQISDLTRHLEP